MSTDSLLETPTDTDQTPVNDKQPLPTEGGHWYDRQGNAVYEVPCTSKDGMRPTTIKDAKKLDLVPSVTAILNIAAKPGLEAWKAKQILEASLTLPRIDGESLDDYAVRVMEDAKAQSALARDKGTQLHAAIEQYIQGATFDATWLPHLETIHDTLHQIDISLFHGKAEHSFASPLGYGGKIDFHNDEPLIIDFKTKECIEDKKQLAWPEHIQQLAAYGFGLHSLNMLIAGNNKFRALNVFIGVNDKQVRVVEYEWSDIVEAFAQFKCLLEFWHRIKKFGTYASLSKKAGETSTESRQPK